jgi:hypothetical protein
VPEACVQKDFFRKGGSLHRKNIIHLECSEQEFYLQANHLFFVGIDTDYKLDFLGLRLKPKVS